jgi:hypothetical protein
VAVDRVIRVTLGVEAVGAFRDAITGNDDDILLGIEKYIEGRIGSTDLDPYSDPMGVYVDDFSLPR